MNETTSVSKEIRKTWQIPTFETQFWLGKNSRYCIVIPVINEGERIRSLITEMDRIGIADHGQIIIIDGGSTDGSLDCDWLKQHRVSGLLVKTGPGKLSAQLRCAYGFALEQGFEGIVTIDGNNKDDPAAIPGFVTALEQGKDFVQGSRFLPGGVSENTPASRHLAIRCIHAPMLSLCSGFKWTDTTQGFRGYSRRMLLDPKVAPFRDIFDRYELLAYLSYRIPRLGYTCCEIPTTRRYPANGEIPTKISGLHGNWIVLMTLFHACFGNYNP